MVGRTQHGAEHSAFSRYVTAYRRIQLFEIANQWQIPDKQLPMSPGAGRGYMEGGVQGGDGLQPRICRVTRDAPSPKPCRYANILCWGISVRISVDSTANGWDKGTLRALPSTFALAQPPRLVWCRRVTSWDGSRMLPRSHSSQYLYPDPAFLLPPSLILDFFDGRFLVRGHRAVGLARKFGDVVGWFGGVVEESLK